MPEHLSWTRPRFEDGWFIVPTPTSTHTKQAPKNNISGKVKSESMERASYEERVQKKKKRGGTETISWHPSSPLVRCEPSGPTGDTWRVRKVKMGPRWGRGRVCRRHRCGRLYMLLICTWWKKKGMLKKTPQTLELFSLTIYIKKSTVGNCAL